MSRTLFGVITVPSGDTRSTTTTNSSKSKIDENSRVENVAKTENQHDEPHETNVVWKNVVIFAILHLMALYGLYLYVTTAKIVTMIFFWIYGSFGGVGVTGGAHRLWAHRAYKARLPMRIILMLMQSAAHQNSIYEWARDHRVHHKYTDTNADPHNATRGFFFSHMGWLLVRKHPDLRRRGKGVDMTDLVNDSVVAFQKKYFYIIMPIMCFIGPTLIPMYFWGESFKVSFFSTILRYTVSLHFTWLVNSAAHLWGNKPYDKFISPVENLGVALVAYGEGWHNYHHVFPWDYKAAELGNYRANVTTGFIDFFANIGQAYDLKTVPIEAIRRRCAKSGEAAATMKNENSHKTEIWGWEDKDMTRDDKEATQILNKTD